MNITVAKGTAQHYVNDGSNVHALLLDANKVFGKVECVFKVIWGLFGTRVQNGLEFENDWWESKVEWGGYNSVRNKRKEKKYYFMELC